MPSNDPLGCPLPDAGPPDAIALAHGEGCRLMRRLIDERILGILGNDVLRQLGDAAELPAIAGPLAFTTDSFVVSPLFFPGGDIGSLAVFGTVNDLAVSGAAPRWLTLSLIIEEGFPLATLDRVLASVAAASRRVGATVVTGDTKVVPKGAADGLYLNVAGVGEMIAPAPPGPRSLLPGDDILVSGPIGRHGMAVLVSREGLAFEPAPTSDSAPLVDAVAALRSWDIPVRAMRDATRGGVAAVLHEWAAAADATIVIDEQAIPVTPEVRGACELLGLDPIHVANEGTMVVAAPAKASERALAALRTVPESAGAQRIGVVRARSLAPVVVRRLLGREQPLDEPIGAPLPRIC